MTSLFDPITFGAIDAPNRIMMAPLTRGRATRSHVPTPLMAEYYSQRASAGLIISEATGISQQGLGWPGAPGLWSEEQVTAWRPIVQAVHDAGGRMVAQLWHMGRIVHPDYLGGAKPVSASATTAPGKAYTYDGPKPYVESRALEIGEIKNIISDYKLAAEHAMEAGFDGVQLHAANGYLLDQFLRDGTNHRTDNYGGSVENRIRLLIEAAQVLISVAGADRTGVRLSPNDDPQGCGDSESERLFTKVAEALNGLGIAFLEMRASRPESTFHARDAAARSRHSPGVQGCADPEFRLPARRWVAGPAPRRSRRHCIWPAFSGQSRLAGAVCKAGRAQPGRCLNVLHAGARRVHRLSDLCRVWRRPLTVRVRLARFDGVVAYR